MTGILGIVMAAVLFAGFGLLTRGKKARDCHDCIEQARSDACAGCPIADAKTGSNAPHARGDSPSRTQLRLHHSDR
jgi:hypothetical protein